MKGIVLAGGTGSRLWPVTKVVSKQLLPIYDKPMIYYPLSTLMLAGVQDILIITTPQDLDAFKVLLGDGSQLGISLSYVAQAKPEGLAQAFIIGEDFLNGDSCLMILGDNIFHGVGLGEELSKVLPENGAHIFTYEVADPSQYGILTLDQNGSPLSIEEKPTSSDSNLAITGLYFFDKDVAGIAKTVKPSKRGELEITAVIDQYLQNGTLGVTQLSRGTAWLDTGNHNLMQDAAAYIRIIEERTGLKIACIEEVSYRNGWISKVGLEVLAKSHGPSSYGKYLQSLLSTRGE
jgi:glucose-1-phosphate thymidylyltransferase